MSDKATGRVVAVLVLLILVAASLRGYLPGVEREPRQEPQESSASLVYVVALLGVSLAIVAVAVITRVRDPRTAAASAGLPEGRFGGGLGRPSWRVLLIGAGVLVAWLLLVWLLTQLFVPHDITQLRSGPQPSTPPPGNAGTPPQQPEAPTKPGGEVVGYLVASTVIMLLLTVASMVVAFRRRPRSAKPGIVAAEPAVPQAAGGASESLVRAAQVGLTEIGDLGREPRAAIIACYAAMERELAHVPGAAPQDFDTPSEVLARAVEHHTLHIDNAAQLVNLFEEARFSPHVMNEGHRENAVGVLQLVLAELRSAV